MLPAGGGWIGSNVDRRRLDGFRYCQVEVG